MDKSLIISKIRVELRKQKEGLQKERAIIKWVQNFFDESSIEHSSQIRFWQQKAFLSDIKRGTNYSREDHLQARSALLYLNKTISGKSGSNLSSFDLDTEPGFFKITG